MDQRPRDLPDPSVMRAAQPILAPGRGLSLPALARVGVTLTGRPVAVDGEQVSFDGSVAANVAAGDAFAARPGRWSTRSSAAKAWTPRLPSPTTTTRPSTWTRRCQSTCAPRRSAAWCGAPGSAATSPGLTRPGRRRRPPFAPERRRGHAGVWYVGLRWLTRRRSSLFFGFPDDAGIVADAVRAHLTGRRRCREVQTSLRLHQPGWAKPGRASSGSNQPTGAKRRLSVPGGACGSWRPPACRSMRSFGRTATRHGVTARRVAMRCPWYSRAISPTIAPGPTSVTGLPSTSTRRTPSNSRNSSSPCSPCSTRVRPAWRRRNRGLASITATESWRSKADSTAVTIGAESSAPRACGCRTPPATRCHGR